MLCLFLEFTILFFFPQCTYIFPRTSLVNMLSARKFLQQAARRTFFTSASRLVQPNRLNVAIIGQSQFGLEVYKVLRQNGHNIVGVFTIPDLKGKPDILAQGAAEDGTRVFKFKRWRTKGDTIKEVLDQYKEVKADLNVMPFCSQFIPMDVITSPKLGSIVYHPSILPRHRGASAINW